MSQRELLLLAGPLLLGLSAVTIFLVYAALKYAPIISRIFEEKPLFLPMRAAETLGGEDVRFSTDDGLTLRGTLFRGSGPRRAGLVVFCHEYLSDRWSFQPYAGGLLERGFDVFTFDFRSHGESDCEPNYRPLQWVTDHEVRDLKAALAHLRSRPDHDARGFALYGVSRGGSTALVVGADEPDVWGVVTDGAFPTRGTMLAYILRWAEIYVSNPYFWRLMPEWVFRYVAWAGRMRSQRRLNCRYPDVEKAVARLSPRPWMMIHGEKDAYIAPAIARSLFAQGGPPKELWIVPKAKHNRCREVEPERYAERLAAFLVLYAPSSERAPAAAMAAAETRSHFHEPAPDTLHESKVGPSPASSWIGGLTAT